MLSQIMKFIKHIELLFSSQEWNEWMSDWYETNMSQKWVIQFWMWMAHPYRYIITAFDEPFHVSPADIFLLSPRTLS